MKEPQARDRNLPINIESSQKCGLFCFRV